MNTRVGMGYDAHRTISDRTFALGSIGRKEGLAVMAVALVGLV